MSNIQSLHLGGTDLPDIEALEALPSTGGVSTFDFTYHGIRFAARAEDFGDGEARLKLVGDIGPVPFSAEAPVARLGMAHIMMHANNLLGQRFRMADGRLLFGAAAPLATPVTATNLVTSAAGLLIPASPYFDLLAVYMEPGVGIRPEWRRGRQPAPKSRPALTAPAR
ncbi:MAG TPA: hypothetical protein VLL76_04615 [Candidatus Omnitrophota bacterium]|nr:hypothetical protein [Candidatus Omnitrophota bacterium]